MATTAATSTTETTKVKLKLMIDKRANKVLFAEAGKDFVDILFDTLYLPLATVGRLVSNAGMVGCTGNLYQSLENLDEAFLQTNRKKADLLKPLLTNSDLMQTQACPKPLDTTKLYNCSNNHRIVTNVMHTLCPLCSIRNCMNNEVTRLDAVPDESGIVKKLVTYMVKDDLSVTPASMISGISVLQGNVKYIDDLEHRVVEIGPAEVVELLRASLQSNAALTTYFLIEKEFKQEEDSG